MIKNLSITNCATIKKVQIEFKHGLNIITGETGAGKSLIVDAISSVLGSKSDRRTLKPDKGLTVLEITLKNNKETLLKREIPPHGRSKNFINNELSNLSNLIDYSKTDILLFGQQSISDLLMPDNYHKYLDSFSGCEEHRIKISDLLKTIIKTQRELSKLQNEKENQKEAFRLAHYELDEIQSVNPTSEEWTVLNDKIRLLENIERINKLSSESKEILEGDNYSLEILIKELTHRFTELGEIGKNFSQLNEMLSQIEIIKDEVLFSLNKNSDLEYDDQLLTSMRDRKEVLRNLFKKFGGSVDLTLEYKENLLKKLTNFKNYDDRINIALEKLKALEEKILSQADELHKIRIKKSKDLENKIQKMLIRLGFKGAFFQIEIKMKIQGDVIISGRNIDQTGYDDILFLFTANMDLKPELLCNVVSGGELSRLALALQSTILKENLLPTVVFDEIDTGISGKVAQAVGQYLHDLASDHQVIVITHLPQIASYADHYIKIDKIERDGSVSTQSAYANTKEKRINAIAELASGKEVTEETIKYVKSLINYKIKAEK